MRTVRLYNPRVECPDCDRRLPVRVPEDAVRMASQRPAAGLYVSVQCGGRPRRGPGVCGAVVPVYWRDVAAAVAESASVLTLAPAPVAVALSERQRRVCDLVVEGLTDRKIAAAVGVKKPTVRKDIQAAAALLCSTDGDSCRVFPRQTIVAYYRARVQEVAPVDPFKSAA